MTAPSAADRLILALDTGSRKQAEHLVETLGGRIGIWKIGYQLAYSAGGLDLARDLARAGEKVFLDLKLHDIDNTVESAVESVLDIGAAFLTLHAYPRTMRAARRARGQAGLKLLAVTVLTSWDQTDFAEAGYGGDLDTLVARRAGQAREIGIDGIVCSARETAIVKSEAPGLAIVTPGIRPAGATAGDQKRVLTPAAAVRSGIDYLVVGRPITAAPDPAATADAILAEIEAASG